MAAKGTYCKIVVIWRPSAFDLVGRNIWTPRRNLMGWCGRAPAPARMMLGWGDQTEEHRHVQQDKFDC